MGAAMDQYALAANEMLFTIVRFPTYNLRQKQAAEYFNFRP
jgi:hypothetical protein